MQFLGDRAHCMVVIDKEINSQLCVIFAVTEGLQLYCSHWEELIEPWSGSVLQLSTSSHVSFYINKSFFSPSLPLLLFLSCTPTQSLSEAHEDGRRKEGGGWSMTREKGKALLLTLHLQPSIYCFSVFSLSLPLLLFPDTVCIHQYFLSLKSELLRIYTQSVFSLFSKLPNYPRSSLLWQRDVD